MHTELVSKIKPFINKHCWDGIKCLSKRDDWETFEKYNQIIASNILYIKEREACLTYIWKINSNCKKKVILMIPNVEKEGWHYLAVKKLPALLHEMNSKHKCDFYCLNCVHFFLEQKTHLNLMKKYVKIKIFMEL